MKKAVLSYQPFSYVPFVASVLTDHSTRAIPARLEKHTLAMLIIKVLMVFDLMEIRVACPTPQNLYYIPPASSRSSAEV